MRLSDNFQPPQTLVMELTGKWEEDRLSLQQEVAISEKALSVTVATESVNNDLATEVTLTHFHEAQ